MLHKNLLTTVHHSEIAAFEKKLLKELADELSNYLYMKLSQANNVMEFEGYFAQSVRYVTHELSTELHEIDSIVGQEIERIEKTLNPSV